MFSAGLEAGSSSSSGRGRRFLKDRSHRSRLSRNMQVFEPHGPRFELALERLREGEAFSFEGVSFCLAPDGHLEVSVESTWSIENTTEQTALRDLQRAMNLVNDLVARSPSFASIAKIHPQRFSLIHDYGTGSVELGRLLDEKIVWAKGMPFSTGQES